MKNKSLPNPSIKRDALERAPHVKRQSQIPMQYLIALLVASICFSASFAEINNALCYSDFFIECSGPIWLIFLISSFMGLFICVVSTGIQNIVTQPRTSKTLAIYTLTGIFGPKAYLFITGSPVTIFDVGLDLAYGVSAFIAGLVMEVMLHRGSNLSFKRDALKRHR